MKKWIFWGSAVCVLLIAMAGSAQSADKPVYINLVVDLNVPQGASEDQLNAAKDNIVNIFNTFNEKGINWTLVLTNDASEQTRLLLGQLTSIGNIEIAVSGNHSDELISSKSYTEQVDILERSKLYGESCDICGINEVSVTGLCRSPSIKMKIPTRRLIHWASSIIWDFRQVSYMLPDMRLILGLTRLRITNSMPCL